MHQSASVSAACITVTTWTETEAVEPSGDEATLGHVSKERRPADSDYFQFDRTELLSQGDIFRDVPLAYPTPAREILFDEAEGLWGDEEDAGHRRFLSGPFETGPALLITPTCAMSAQGGSGYSHPVRTLVPLRPLVDLVDAGAIREEHLGQIRSRDPLVSYMYVPPVEPAGIPESMALLYMPTTLHHDLIDGQRVAQLAIEGARQLQRKLAWFMSGMRIHRAEFDPPMD